MAELAKRSGVPTPTIKHYTREGLLPGPEIRTSRNMAYYDARVVARIRAIKELQATRFLPLKVISDLLEPSPSARIRAERDSAHRRLLTALGPSIRARIDQRLAGRAASGRARPAGGLGQQRRKRSEVMRTLGVSRAELDQLERAGILELRGAGATAGYSGADLLILDVIAGVRQRGLSAVFPLSLAEPYRAAVQRLVELELDLFRHRVTAGVPLPGPLHEVAQHAMELSEQLILGLRAKLLPRLLEQLAPRR